MWCLPTHGRPEKIKRLLSSMSDDDKAQNVVVVFWRNDTKLAKYDRDAFPKHWILWTQDAEWCGEKLNATLRVFPDERFYGLLTDDVVLSTPGMLKQLELSAGRDKLAWPDDGVHHHMLATHPCCGGEFINALGFWAHPLFRQDRIDSVLYKVAKQTDRAVYRGDLRLQVFHPRVNLPHENDATYEKAIDVNSRATDDWYGFEANELPQLVAQVKERLS